MTDDSSWETKQLSKLNERPLLNSATSYKHMPNHIGNSNSTYIERAIYSPNINDRNASNPVIFSPPKTPDREVKDVKELDQYYDQLDSKPQKDIKPRYRKKRAAQSLNEVYSKFTGYSPIQGKTPPTLTELSPSTDHEEHTIKPDHTYALENESAVSSGKDRSLLDNFTSMLYESAPTEDGVQMMIDHEVIPAADVDPIQQEELVVPAEILAKDISKEVSPIKDKELDDSDFQKDSLRDEFTFMLEESASITDNANNMEIDDECLPLEELPSLSREHDRDEERLKNPIIDDCPKVEEDIFVKLPVLLAKINFDIDIFNSFDLACPIANVTKIDWVIESFVTRTLLPSRTVFIKGILIAEIEYVSEKTSTLHTLKVPMNWDKVVDVHWLASPENSKSDQKEYAFRTYDQADHSHYEYSQVFAEQIEEDLQSINFIWHNKLDAQGDTRKIHIEGSANISIDLLQPQYINLSSYSFPKQMRSSY